MTKILTAAMLIGAAVLTGCAGNNPAPIPVPTPSATPSTEPLPERDPLTNYTGEEGISAFVRYYNELINYAYRTGNARGLKDASTAECVACTRIAKTVEDIYDAGGKVAGSQSTIHKLTILNPQDTKNIRIVLVLSTSATKGTDSAGAHDFERASFQQHENGLDAFSDSEHLAGQGHLQLGGAMIHKVMGSGLAALLLMSAPHPTPPGSPEENCGAHSCKPTVSSDEEAFTVGGTSSSERGDIGDGGSNSGGGSSNPSAPTGPIVIDVWQTECPSDRQQDGGSFCAGAEAIPCPPGQTPHWHLRRIIERPTGTLLQENNLGRECHTPIANANPITPATVYAQWRRYPMPTPQIRIQPAAFTLLRFPTIFYTPTRPAPITTTILGHHVKITPHASHFTWHFGDGTQLNTDHPGQAYPDQTITHRYTWRTPKIPFHTHLTITYTATYSIDGGPTQTIPQTITLTSPDTPILVKTARSVLIDPNTPYNDTPYNPNTPDPNIQNPWQS